MRALMLAVILAPSVALADEPACKADGDRVTCTRAGFDVLVKRLIDADALAKERAIRLDAADQSVAESKAALDACLAKPPPEPVVVKPTAMRALSPVVAGVVGAAVLTASVAADWSLSGRATGAVVGSALIGAGILFALP